MQKKLKIVLKSVDEIIPYWRNPRKNDKTVDALVEVIEKYGFNVPIVIDKNNVIVKGHARLKAAKRLGLDKVPCIVSEASEEAIKADRISDNKIQEMSAWDFTKLELEFQKIGDMKFDKLFHPEKLPKVDYTKLEMPDFQPAQPDFDFGEEEEAEKHYEPQSGDYAAETVFEHEHEHEASPVPPAPAEQEAESEKVCKTICPYCGGIVYVKI